MIIKVVDPHQNARMMTEQYIMALYGCSPAEFARQLEKELLESDSKASKREDEDEPGGGKCGRETNVQ
jgi:hypothetical protein